MTTKKNVSFSDRHFEFADGKVQQGINASFSSVVALGLEVLMQDEAERNMALSAMQSAIAERMKTPRSEWLAGTSDLVSKARKHLEAKQ